LDGVKGQAHADRRDFHKDTKPDSGNYPAARETTRVDHHEGKNHQCLSDNDLVKQTRHFTLRPPEIWRLSVNIFEKNAVEEPAPQEDENVCGNERENESLHKLDVSDLSSRARIGLVDRADH
jgi:hypothetical protein